MRWRGRPRPSRSSAGRSAAVRSPGGRCGTACGKCSSSSRSIGTVAAGALNAAAAFARDRRYRRGRLRMARLPAPRPDRADRRGAPRLCRRTCGGAAAGEKSDREAGTARMRIRQDAATLLAGVAAGSGGCASVAVAARARHRVAVAGRACLGMGDRGCRARPAGMAAFAAGPAAGERRGTPRAGRHGRAVRAAGTSSSATRGPACSRSRTRPHRFHSPRSIRSSPGPGDGRGGRAPLPSGGRQRVGAIQPARGHAAGRAPVPGGPPRGAPPHPGDQDAAAQSPVVGAAAARALWRGRANGLARGLRPVAPRRAPCSIRFRRPVRRPAACSSRRPRASFPIGCAHTRRGCWCSRSAVPPSTSIPVGLRSRTTRCAPRASSDAAAAARAGRARADPPGRPGQRRQVEPPECVGTGDAVRGRAVADDRARRGISARDWKDVRRSARRHAGPRRAHRRRTCRSRRSAPTSSCGSPRRRSRRASPTVKALMIFAPGRRRSLRAGRRPFFSR